MKKLTLLTLCFALFLTKNANAQLITTVAGNLAPTYGGDGGPATDASFNWPVALAIDSIGDLYIADLDNETIRQVTASGFISTVAGNTRAGYDGDGFSSDVAELNNPMDVVLDAMGNFYIADQYNHVVRMVNHAGIISTFAGNGYEASSGIGGYSGDGTPAVEAEFYAPAGIAFDRIGNLYISDIGNSVVRKVDTAGIITTVVGNGSGTGYSGDGGPASVAKLYIPAGITVDSIGNLYIADQNNNVIRKVNTSGIISTVAGNGYQADTLLHAGGYTGDGGPATAAELWGPTGVAVDRAGNLYIADKYNMVIRMVNTAGIITTFAGDGSGGFYGDGGSARLAELNYPNGVSVDKAGNVYIADMNNNVIRKVTAGSHATAGIDNVSAADNKLQIVQNPNSGTFQLEGAMAQCTDQNAAVTVMDAQGQVVYSGNTVVQNGNINTQISLGGNLPDGVYLLQVNSGSEIGAVRFVIKK